MSDPRKFKGDVVVEGELNLPAQTASTVPVLDASKNIISSSVTSATLAFLDATSSVQDQLDDKIPLAQKGANNGVATLDAGGKVPVTQLPSSVMTYEGTWNASTNTPTLVNGTGDAGQVYLTSVAGTVDFGAGPITFALGDWVIYSGTIWQESKNSNAVVSVNSQTGVVVLDTDDIAEGTALYFTDERAQDAVGAILVDSDTVALVYTDATPSIEANVITQMSITSDASGLMLAGDEATPGNTQYYGTDASGVKGFHAIPAQGSTGDIQQTSFSAADSVVSPANVTGLAFANGSVRAFSALVSVSIDATSDLFEEFHLQGIQKSASWNMSVDSVGDNSGITFSITSAGQVQYTSGTVPGFVSNTIKFRAICTNV
jgi:hypothetical protein